MPNTAGTLRRAAHLISHRGLHTGDQFVDQATDTADLAAAVFVAAEGHIPAEFYTDENTSLEIIAASAGAMAAIRTLSDSLITSAPYTEIAPGLDIPDYIEHVSSWAISNHAFGDRPPTVSEVIGALHRAATAADKLAVFPHQTERSAA